MKTYVTILIVASATAACDKTPTDATHTTSATVNSQGQGSQDKGSDNSGAPSPGTQGNSPADTEATRVMKNLLMTDDSLSPEARDLRIITNNGVTVISGLVKTEEERQSILAKARAAAGNNRIDDQMSISFESTQP
jgi:osmotically-inducible protein OsmY